MPTYPKLQVLQVEALDKNIADFTKDLATKRKATGKNVKTEVAALEKRIKEGTQILVTRVTKDIKTAQTGFRTLELYVETCASTASSRLKDAKDGLARFKQSNNVAELQPCANVKGDVETSAHDANAETLKFAASWNAYRETNFKLDKTLLKEFTTIRKKIIDETAVLRAKINKIAALAVEAQAVEAAANAAQQATAATEQDKLQQAQDLHDSIDHTLTELYKKNDPKTITNGKSQVENWIKTPNFATFQVQFEDRQAKYKAMKATASASSAARDSLKRTLETSQSLFSGRDAKDAKIGPVLKALTKRFKDFDAEVDQALDDLKEVIGLMNKAQERLDKGA